MSPIPTRPRNVRARVAVVFALVMLLPSVASPIGKLPSGVSQQGSVQVPAKKPPVPAPVGRFPSGASPYGALDMAGNVSEWVADWYDENYYASSPSRNPKGPDSGDFRVLRGGSWYFVQFNARAALRVRLGPGGWNDFYGFHCAQDSW